LATMMKNNVFRPDLYYRLAVLPLTIPSLRDRREDIPSLVQHFLKRSSQKHGKSEIKVAPDGIDALVHNPWPGNVRELENLIERVVVTTKKACLSVEDLFMSTGEAASPMDLSSVGKAALKEAERKKILETLQKTKGDKTKAARLLKVSRASLYNKIKTYQI
ncbi:MAG: helix-turn-helix domain-containing protein, partial [Nitrospirales bacterium]|nr:helix-turn-helix domain-containing protein [Nitrospirales bacterium]